MTKIEIIGRGNVACHLQKAMYGKAEVKLINPHTLENMDRDSDIILISVPDHAIREMADKIRSMSISTNTIVAHTSGTTDISVLDCLRQQVGVLYPLQTFSKEVPLDYSEIPIFVEGVNPKCTEKLMTVAGYISEKVYKATSRERRKLHIASVLACNFVNHLWALADQYLDFNGLSFDMIKPLIKETTRKALCNAPSDVQTGPAIRRDYNTMDSHLAMLESSPATRNIYKEISESIIRLDDERNRL